MSPNTESYIYELYLTADWTLSDLASRYCVDVDEIERIIYYYKCLDVS